MLFLTSFALKFNELEESIEEAIALRHRSNSVAFVLGERECCQTSHIEEAIEEEQRLDGLQVQHRTQSIDEFFWCRIGFLGWLLLLLVEVTTRPARGGGDRKSVV